MSFRFLAKWRLAGDDKVPRFLKNNSGFWRIRLILTLSACTRTWADVGLSVASYGLYGIIWPWPLRSFPALTSRDSYSCRSAFSCINSVPHVPRPLRACMSQYSNGLTSSAQLSSHYIQGINCNLLPCGLVNSRLPGTLIAHPC